MHSATPCVPRPHEPAVSDTARLLRRHRSIRTYRADPIDPALVTRVLDDALAGGSSSGNLNAVSVVMSRDAQRRERLYALHAEQPMIRQAPLVLTFCADWFRTREWLRRRHARDNFDNLIGFLVGAFDAMILAQNACLGFEAHGLGICYMGTTLHACEELADFLELPATCLPVTSVVVGWPAEDPPKRDRLPVAAWLHDERYQRPDDAQIDATFAEREVKGWNRYMAVPELRERIEAAGIRSLAEFYTSEHKYFKPLFDRDSARYRDALVRRDFGTGL